MLPAPADDIEDYPLEEAMAVLPENHRQVILLRYYEGLSCQEVATRLDMPLGTVTKTLSRAYALLRQELKARGLRGTNSQQNRTTMNCAECRDNLVVCAEGLLEREETHQFRAHLETCAECRAEYE